MDFDGSILDVITSSTDVTSLSSSAPALNITLTNLYPALSQFEGHLDHKYINTINPFWLKFDPPTAGIHYMIAILYTIITAFGCFGNGVVILMFLSCKSLRTPASTLVINLALSDFCMIATSPFVIYNSVSLGPAVGHFGCQLYGFIGCLTEIASQITLAAISVDRYNVVVYPLDPLKSTTILRSCLIVAFTWCYSLIFSVIPALDIGLSDYSPDGYLTTCSFDCITKSTYARIFMLVFFIGAWIIPFIVIGYCYYHILMNVISANTIQSTKDVNKLELKLTSLVIGVFGLWFLSWIPYVVLIMIGVSGNENFLTPILSMVPAFCCKLAACLHPYIYAVKHPRFHSEFVRIFLGRQISKESIYEIPGQPSFSTRAKKRRANNDMFEECTL